ncbi:MAG: ATP-binding cassette domain-containing protein [Rhizobiaceae bacterium]|nr:ATP-binding cassette domain-containing protein [Rhizobiaceae bacterium]
MDGKGLRLDDIRISLNGAPLLSIAHTIAPGEVLTVMGPSGSGKSTLLAFIGGFLDPAFEASGQVFIDDEDLTPVASEDRHVGILFQDPLLFPHMTVAGNLTFAIPATISGRVRRRDIACRALEGVELAGYEDRDPDTLSGGQKARVALARVLLAEPRALLLDEPFSKLDAELRQQMRDLVFSKARQSGLPTLLVTHDEADAAAAGGNVIRLGG